MKTVVCTGVSPLLMNNWNPCEVHVGTRRLTPKEEAEKKLYTQDGIIGIPADMLMRCLVEAGRRTRLGSRKLLTTARQSLVPSLVTVRESFLPLATQEWAVDVHPTCMLGVPGIARPRFNTWSFQATIHSHELPDDVLQQLFHVAGTMVGLGDFRPAMRGQFGRFRAEQWEGAPAGDLAA